MDSVSLHIKKKLELPSTIENCNEKDNGSSQRTNPKSSSNPTVVAPTSTKSSSSITPSTGTQTEKTKIIE